MDRREEGGAVRAGGGAAGGSKLGRLKALAQRQAPQPRGGKVLTAANASRQQQGDVRPGGGAGGGDCGGLALSAALA